MRVIGYAYEADLHCAACTDKRFKRADLDTVEDSEGNPVHPVFSTDEQLEPPHCGDCGVPLE